MVRRRTLYCTQLRRQQLLVLYRTANKTFLLLPLGTQTLSKANKDGEAIGLVHASCNGCCIEESGVNRQQALLVMRERVLGAVYLSGMRSA